MLQTVEAEIDVNGTVHWQEPLTITKPTRALVTLLEESPSTQAGKGNVKEILAFLKANRLPEEFRRSAEEIDAQIEEERNSWE